MQGEGSGAALGTQGRSIKLVAKDRVWGYFHRQTMEDKRNKPCKCGAV
jgi:hypothetical protein